MRKQFFGETVEGRFSFDPGRLRIKRGGDEWEPITVRDADFISNELQGDQVPLEDIFALMEIHLPERHFSVDALSKDRGVLTLIVEDTLRLSPGLVKQPKTLVSNLLSRSLTQSPAVHISGNMVKIRFDPSLVPGSPLCRTQTLSGKITLDVLTMGNIFRKLASRVREAIEIRYQDSGREPVEVSVQLPREARI